MADAEPIASDGGAKETGDGAVDESQKPGVGGTGTAPEEGLKMGGGDPGDPDKDAETEAYLGMDVPWDWCH